MPTSKNIEIGKTGEALAISFLRAKGYAILHVNWRAGHNEVDIIAKDNNTTVFVEVKTRVTDNMGNPEDAVKKAKIKELKKTAEAYLLQIGWEEVRFDVIAITLWPDAETEIMHFEDAFF